MVERFYQIGDDLLAVLSNGELLASQLNKLSWEKIQAGSGEVRAVAWVIE
jgi:hypothetical protein